MKHLILIGTALALAAGLCACVPDGPHAPRAALEACRSPRALYAVRRAALQRAGALGAPAGTLERLKRDGRATLEDPEVGDYDQDTGVTTCRALLRLQPPGEGAQEISSNVAYEAAPLGGGRYRYRLTDPGEVAQAIASLGPLPESASPASSAAENAATVAPNPDTQTLDDAAAAGDTGRSRRASPAPTPAHDAAPAAPAATPATPPQR